MFLLFHLYVNMPRYIRLLLTNNDGMVFVQRQTIGKPAVYLETLGLMKQGN